MTFEPSHDLELVRQILITPSCWCRMVSDAAPSRESFMVEPKAFQAIVAKDGERVLGVFLLFPKWPACAEVHFCLLPTQWGNTRNLAEEFLAWVWRSTSLNMLLGPVPDYNRLALNLARSVGFKEFKRERQGSTKHGKPFERIVTMIERPAA